MLSRLARFLSMKQVSLPVAIQANLDILSSVSPADEESAGKLIKTYFHLCNDLKFNRISINWNSHPSIIASLSKLSPILSSVDGKNINNLIISLHYLGVYSNPIWKTLESRFLQSGQENLEVNQIPVVISAFSYSKCENKVLWNLLNTKMRKEYLVKQELTLSNAIFTYKSLLLCSNLTPDLTQMFKLKIIQEVKKVNPSMITELLNAMSRDKTYDRELAFVLIQRTMAVLNHFDSNLLCVVLVALHVMKQDRNKIEKVENQIIENIETLTMKSISSIIYAYTRPACKSNKDCQNFMLHIFNYYTCQRERLRSEAGMTAATAAHEVRITGAAIELGYKIPDDKIKTIYKQIKETDAVFKPTDSNFHLYQNLEKYIGYLSFNNSK